MALREASGAPPLAEARASVCSASVLSPGAAAWCPAQPQPGARASPTPKQVLCVRARSTALEDLGRRFTADDKRMEEGRGRAEEVSHLAQG